MNRTTRTWTATLTALTLLNLAVYTIGHHAGLKIGEETIYGPLAGLASLGLIFTILTGVVIFAALLIGIFEWIHKADH